jgi:hypothetical protein
MICSGHQNPSHLEAACPVAVGKTRGRQQWLRDGDYKNEFGKRKKHGEIKKKGSASFSLSISLCVSLEFLFSFSTCVFCLFWFVLFFFVFFFWPPLPFTWENAQHQVCAG